MAGKHVLIGDFSFKADVLRDIHFDAASIVLLDHHKTAEADLGGFNRLPEGEGLTYVSQNIDRLGGTLVEFDMNRSGARMMWEFCHPGEEVPLLIRLIEDRDLWRFSMPETKPFSLWLRSHPYDFEEWELIAQQLNDGRDSARIFAEAEAMQRFYDQKIAEMIREARWITIHGHKVPAVNCSWAFASDVAHELLSAFQNAPFAACYYDRGDGCRSYSLRSEDHREDVSVVAKRYGGGGHRNAAGFEVPLS